MYASYTGQAPETIDYGPGKTIGSLHEHVRRFSYIDLSKIAHALATTKEDKSNPFNANYPEGPTLFAWEGIVRDELQWRESLEWERK
jgi:hypothetical protein